MKIKYEVCDRKMESAKRWERWLTALKSALYPLFAGAVAIPSARRGPERGLILEDANAVLELFGVAFALRVVIVMAPFLSDTSIV